MFNIHFFIERWKWNPIFGIYVSTKGRFRNQDKKDIPVQIGDSGYCMVYCGGTVHRHLSAHRVVMLTWRPTDNAENLTVDHLDHNKRNNALDNLEWVTVDENQRRASADYINIKVEGDASLVDKVTVTVVPNELATTKYPYYLRFAGGAVMSIEQMAEMFFETHGKCFGDGKPMASVGEMSQRLFEQTKSKKKVLGFKFTKVPKQ